VSHPPRRTARISLTAAITVVTMALTWIFLGKGKENALALQTAVAGGHARPIVQEAAEVHLESLTSLAKTLSSLPPATHEDYRSFAARALGRGSSLLGVNRVDDRFRLRDLFPEAVNQTVQGLDLKTRMDALPAAYRAATSRKPAATNILDLAQGGQGLMVYAPMVRQDRWEGHVEGVLRHRDFLERSLLPELKGYEVAVMEEETTRMLFPEDGRRLWEHPTDADYFIRLRWADKSWWVLLRPVRRPGRILWIVLALFLQAVIGAGVLAREMKR
jgi:sensor domain CHASE-containing protein